MKKIILIIAILTIVFVSLNAQNIVVDGFVRKTVMMGGMPGYVNVPDFQYHIIVHGYDVNSNRLFNVFVPVVNGHYLIPVDMFEGINWDEVDNIWVYLDGSDQLPITIRPYTGNHRVSFTLNDKLY